MEKGQELLTDSITGRAGLYKTRCCLGSDGIEVCSLALAGVVSDGAASTFDGGRETVGGAGG